MGLSESKPNKESNALIIQKNLLKFVPFEVNYNGSDLEGIFYFVCKKCHINSVDGFAQIISCDKACKYGMMMFDSNQSLFWHSNNRPNRYFVLYFPNYKIAMSGYSFQTHEFGHPCSWKVEGRNFEDDEEIDFDANENWDPIDEHIRSPIFENDNFVTHYFPCLSKCSYSCFKFSQISKNIDKNSNYYFALNRLEIFGIVDKKF
ncbi:hypothetical protein TRFO_04045 [Tritrichomonas foetus]|uniref:Uncharacterized protein n=1 Tax=Tritrichomonas foetus TaxID=1144522 RepID=A0A1J4KJ31_9EUKA|nr:hypothetical protein TRFO_04045 [Tritrichomonas foetus]|eukprot:OHT11098.1 hypothetical protein TRFO_04045 [Tritrichomonas foetus]